MLLDKVEFVCFERMILIYFDYHLNTFLMLYYGNRLKNLDLVFVFKDYEKPVTRIASIFTD